MVPDARSSHSGVDDLSIGQKKYKKMDESLGIGYLSLNFHLFQSYSLKSLFKYHYSQLS